MYRETKPLRLKKSEFLQHIPIYSQTLSCETVHEWEKPFAELYTHEILEISMVTEGNGFHQILNQNLYLK